MLVAILLLTAAQFVRPVIVQHDHRPVADAEVRCGAAVVRTDKDGRASISVPDAGCTLVVVKEGLAPVTLPVTATGGLISVDLVEIPEIEESIIVSATRTGRLASDQPLRVEVVNREEIQEKLLMTPGDIAMLLNETGGIRLQPTSPALGAATVRVQGLTGRYTPVLTDGLPINNTQTAALGLLQVPPMDLKQVEVIKGAASALYGASALGGVINLVSRPPAAAHEGEALFNVTSRAGTDSVLWLSGPIGEHRGYTFLAGAHTQEAADVDEDAWSDLPRYRRVLARPRFVFSQGGASLEVTAGLLDESRTGGTVDPARHVQSVNTLRGDVGVIARRTAGASVIVARGSASSIRHDHQYGGDAYADRHGAQFGEVSILRGMGAHAIVAGLAVDRQTYQAPAWPAFDYAWTTPGVFIQDDWTIHPRWSVSMSGRIDWHPQYGTFASPRVSSLVRVAGWAARASYGGGFFAPTPLTEETDEVGLPYVQPPAGLVAERGRTWSFDVSRHFGIVEVSATAFGSRIDDPLSVDPVDADDGTSRLVLSNRPAPTRTSGAELFGRVRKGPWIVTASWTWVKATEVEADGGGVEVPLTPGRTWGVVAAWERHGAARVGVEVYRTGRQRLEDNPYRTESDPYTIVGVLAERRVGRVRLFINLENITNVRLSKTHPLLLPAPTALGQWTVDAWAPLEGRTINGGLRFGF